jgi:hypothetical protein
VITVMKFRTNRALAVLAVLTGSLCLRAGAAPADLVRITAYPANIELNTSRDRQSIIVQALYSNGLTADVTSAAKLTLGDPALAKIEKGTLLPAKDGSTQLAIAFEGQSVSLPIEVKNAASERPISFKLDVMPVFMKAGCNTGSCHGAARGKDGFRLSLFGFDPDGDYFRLTRELNGRRINLALVHDSLVLEKSGGRVSHTGGKRFSEDSELYGTLARWLEARAPRDPGDIPHPTGIEFYPPSAVLNGNGATQQLTVRALYSDGTDRDVTHLAYFLSNNETSAKVSQKGVVSAGARGEAFIMARFNTFTVGSHFIVLPKDLEFQFPQVAENNYVDKLINEKLKKLRVAPSELCSDEVFLRRAYLDVIGLLPTAEEYNRFCSSEEKDKRSALVDELLGRKEFVELWVMKWAELLQIRSSNQVSYKAMLLYYNWLQDKIANNVPMDRMVSELLGASGGTFKSPATNYYQNETNTLKVAENVAQVFMGMRIQCAQCHNHPFDRWTQNDYYGFASFFSQIGRKRAEDPRETIVFNSRSGEVRHPVGNRVMKPKFLGGEVPDLKGQDRRVAMANWLASAENPFFATNLANMVWAHFFGRGIIDEVDDVRVSNPPANAKLLKELGRRFTDYKYDFKRLVRDICTSRTYQLATQTNASNKSDIRNFSHSSLRRIRSEILLDCITQVTGTSNKFRGLPKGARAVQIADGSTTNYFLQAFGRAKRETVCSCEVQMEPNLSQALHLMNGDTVERKVKDGRLVETRLEGKKTPAEIIEELYIRCFCRKPDEKERAGLDTLLKSAPNQKEFLEDLFWSLLNSREFLFNH